MAKKKKRKGSGAAGAQESPGNKELTTLLEEIIAESLNPDCNIIVLDGKIRDLEESLGKEYVSFLGKKIAQLRGPEQRVILDLLVRNKTKAVIEQLKKIGENTDLSLKVRLRALVQMQEWGQSAPQETVDELQAAEEILNEVERYTAVDMAFNERDDSGIETTYRQLPGSVRRILLRQILDDYPEQTSMILRLIQDDKDLDEHILDTLADRETAEVGDLFATLAVTVQDKKMRRSLKRHIFQLRQKGLRIDIPEESKDETPKIRSIEPPEVSSYVTGIDYLGERLLFLSKPVAGWGVVFFQIALSDQEGIKTFNVFDLKRKEIKQFLKRVEEMGTLQLIPIPVAYCYYLIEEAYRLSLQKRLALPEQYGQWRSEINELKGELREPLIYTALGPENLQEEDRKRLCSTYDSLFGETYFGEWFLEPRLVWEYIEKIKDVDHSPLVLNTFQKEERKNEVILQAARAVFDEELRRVYKRRIEEMAYILYYNKAIDAARLAASAALDLGTEGIPSDQHEFLRGLIRRSVRFYLEGEKEQHKDSLLIAPR